MTKLEILSYLKKVGTAQNRKVYARHGAKEPMFGVSFAELNKLKKKIKVDHATALELWQSGNTDARTLALMIADPDQITSTQLDSWLKEVDYYLLSDYLASLTSKSKHASGKIKKWAAGKNEFVRSTGYSIIASYLKNGGEISVTEGKKILTTIGKEIHQSPNRARYSMNNALIALGSYNPKLTEVAIKTAEQIGKVEVDHGETSCKTPDAVPYIKKTVAHLNRKK